MSGFANGRRDGYDTRVFDSSQRPLEDRELPDEADLDDDDETDVSPCPACGELIYEDAPQCPYCREWVVRGDVGLRDSGKWYVRAGLFLTRTLLINWFFWMAVTAVGIAAVVISRLRK